MTQALRADGSLPSTDPEAEDDAAAYAAYQTSYDVTREELSQQFEAQTKIFLTDEDSAVRRAFLGSVVEMCVFFGDSLARDLILTHLNTYLNDPDWTLKCAFFETVVGVALFIGGPSLEEFILPLMVQALTDSEETVTEQVIRSLSSMARLGLFQRWIVLELVLIVTRFTLHPNQWVREAAAQFISVTGTHLTQADVKSLVDPLIKPVLKIPSGDISEVAILDALKKPFPRPALDMARLWATKADKGNFWKAAQNAKSFSFDASSNKSLIDLYRGVDDRPLGKGPKSEEDEQWLTRLRNVGMRSEDELKLVALRDYIWRHVLRAEKEPAASVISPYNHVVSLTSLKIPLQNVLFDDDMRYYDQIAKQSGGQNRNQQVTLADALNDAALPQIPKAVMDSQRLFSESDVPRQQHRRPSDSESEVSGALSVNTTTVDGKLAVPQRITQEDTQLSTSPSSQLSTGSQRPHHAIRHKGSAINLIMRADTGSKAIAETSTDSVNAKGKVNIPSSHKETPRTVSPAQSSTPKPGAAHSYPGKDPTVRKYLDDMHVANFPLDIAEFGPLVQTLKRGPIPTSSTHLAGGRWRPQGRLVAAIGEHTAQVTAIAVASDHSFFITGSDDGTVRIWDTSRLERNVTHRSRLLHKHTSEAQITALAFIEATHSFISTASDGTVNVVKVDQSESGGNIRYGKSQILRDWRIPSAEDSKEYAVKIEHYRHEGQSICMILTSTCRILALDLRSMNISFELSNPAEHGTPTSFCVHRRRQWLLVGTSHGVIDLWDLRFRLRLRSWTFRTPAPIWQLTLHPGRRSAHKMRVCISGGTAPDHVSVWDLEKLSCTEVFSTSTEFATPKVGSRDLELISLDDEKPESQIDRIVGSVSRNTNLSQPAGKQGMQQSIRSFVMRMHISDDLTDANEARNALLITAGPDWRVRFWDPDRLANSTVVNGTVTSGQQIEFSASLVGADTKVYTSSSSNANDTLKEGVPSPSPSRSAKSSSIKASKSQDKAAVSNVKVSRYDTIRNSAQHLLKGHRDDVTCVALIERPFGMVVSADRSGMIYVFQ